MTDLYLPPSRGREQTSSDDAAYFAEVANRTTMLTRTAPHLSQMPDVVQSLAMNPGLTYTDLAYQSTSLAAQMDMERMVGTMLELPGSSQRALFNQLTGPQQAAMAQMGYRPPERGSLLDDTGNNRLAMALGPIAGVAQAGFGAIGGAVGPAFGLAFDAMDWAWDRPAHLFRVWEQSSTEQKLAGLATGIAAAAGIVASPFTGGLSLSLTAAAVGGGALVGSQVGIAAVNPAAWWDTMGATYDGERVFTVAAQRQARELVGNNEYLNAIVRDIAYEGDLEMLVREFAGVENATSGNMLSISIDRVAEQMVDRSSPEFRQVTEALQRLVLDENFAKAVDVLQNGKVSFGRWMAREAGLVPGTGYYSFASGMYDGLFGIALDPTLVGWSAHRARHAYRFAIPFTDDIGDTTRALQHAYENQRGFAQTLDVMAESVNRGDFQQLRTFVPEAQAIFDPLQAWSRRQAAINPNFSLDGKQVLRYFQTQEGVVQLMRGRSMRLGAGKVIMPSLGTTGMAWARTKNFTRSAISFADDNQIAARSTRGTRAVAAGNITRESAESLDDGLLEIADAAADSVRRNFNIDMTPEERTVVDRFLEMHQDYATMRDDNSWLGLFVRAHKDAVTVIRARNLADDEALRLMDAFERPKVFADLADEPMTVMIGQDDFLRVGAGGKPAAGSKMGPGQDELVIYVDRESAAAMQQRLSSGSRAFDEDLGLVGKFADDPDPRPITWSTEPMRGHVAVQWNTKTGHVYVRGEVTGIDRTAAEALQVGRGDHIEATARFWSSRVIQEADAPVRRNADLMPMADDVMRLQNRPVPRAALGTDEHEVLRRFVNFIDRIPIMRIIERNAGALLGSFTAQVPTSVINLRNATELAKYVDLGRVMGVPSDVRQAWMAMMMGQSTDAGRLLAVDAYMDTMLRAAGIDVLPEGVDLSQRFIAKYHQAFGSNGIDELIIGGRVRHTGIMPTNDMSLALHVPDLKELRQAVARGTVLRYVLGVTDHTLLEQAMNRFWKPSVLLRIGFIPRAAGEEMMAHIARNGLSGLLREMGERNVYEAQVARSEAKALTHFGVDELDEVMLETIERMKMMPHARWLEGLTSRVVGNRLSHSFWEGYSTAMRNWMTTGLLSDVDMSWMSDKMRNALLGDDASLRRMFATGADPAFQRAMQSWYTANGDIVMRTVTSSNHGWNELANNRNIVKVLRQENGGFVEEQMVRLRGQYEFRPVGDEYYATGFVEQLGYTLSDPLVVRAFNDNFGRVIPDTLGGNVEAARTLQGAATQLSDALQRQSGLNRRILAIALDDIDNPSADALETMIDLIDTERRRLTRARREKLEGYEDLEPGQYLPGEKFSAAESRLERMSAKFQDYLYDQSEHATFLDLLADLVTVKKDDPSAAMALRSFVASIKEQPDDVQRWAVYHAQWGHTHTDPSFLTMQEAAQGFVRQMVALTNDPRYGNVRQRALQASMHEGLPVLNPVEGGMRRNYAPSMELDDLHSLRELIAGRELARRQNQAADVASYVNRVDDIEAEQAYWATRQAAGDTSRQELTGEAAFVRDVMETLDAQLAAGPADLELLAVHGDYVLDALEALARREGVTMREMFDRVLADSVQDQMLNPERYQELRLAAMQAGPPSPEMLRGQIREEIMSKLAQARLADGVLHEFTFRDLNEMIDLLLTQPTIIDDMIEGAARSGFSGSVPVPIIATLDPVAARALGDALTSVARGSSGLIDGPRRISYFDRVEAYKPWRRPTPIDETAGQASRPPSGIDPQAMFHEVHRVPDELVLPDGRVQYAMEDAIERWAESILERTLQVTTAHQSDMVATTELFEVMRNGSRRRIEPWRDGVNPREVALDPSRSYETADGTAVIFGRREFMKPMSRVDEDYVPNNVLLQEQPMPWNVVGRALQDGMEGLTSSAVYGSNGRHLHLRVRDVADTPGYSLPSHVMSEIQVVHKQNRWDNAVQRGFGGIAKAIDAIARTPMARHEYVKAYVQTERAARWMIEDSIIQRAVSDVAGGDALRIVDLSDEGLIDILDAFADEAGRRFPALQGRRGETLLQRIAELDGKGRAEIARVMRSWGRGGNVIDADMENLVAFLQAPWFHLSMRNVDLNDQVAVVRQLVENTDRYLDIPMANLDNAIATLRGVLPREAFRDEDALKAAMDSLRQARSMFKVIDDQITDIARERSIINTVPFIDSHEIRSQFGDYTRNLLPFWYAEENFLKRWGKTLKLNPVALRKAQLTYMGMKETGVLRTDANGRDWFVYPGSGLLSETLGRIPGLEVLPIGVLFQTELNRMLPGFDRVGAPSPSPFIGAGIEGMVQMFPEMRRTQRAIVGDIGLNRGVLGQFMPTTLANIVHPFRDERSSTRIASSMMSAAAYMDATGNGLPADATDAERDDYMRRLRNHSRIIAVAQAITAFIVPGSPSQTVTGEAVLTPKSLTGLGITDIPNMLREEYVLLIQRLGIEEGTAAFLEQNRDANLGDIVNPLAFTVPRSRSASGAWLPATMESVVFYEQNADWINSMPNAGPFFLPPDAENRGFVEDYAYTQQTIEGLRVRQTPDEFLDALKFKEGSQLYFATKKEYDIERVRMREMGLSDEMKALDAAWSMWANIHKAQHPIFARQLESGDGRVRRSKILAEMRIALADPDGPNPWHADDMRDMIAAFDAYQTNIGALATDRRESTREAVRQYRFQFEALMEGYVQQKPHLENLWLSVLRPESDFEI